MNSMKVMSEYQRKARSAVSGREVMQKGGKLTREAVYAGGKQKGKS